jgi:hypothetical protein
MTAEAFLPYPTINNAQGPVRRSNTGKTHSQDRAQMTGGTNKRNTLPGGQGEKHSKSCAQYTGSLTNTVDDPLLPGILVPSGKRLVYSPHSLKTEDEAPDAESPADRQRRVISGPQYAPW